MAGLEDGALPILIVGDAAAKAVAARLSAVFPGASLEPIAADGGPGAILRALDTGQACVYVGPIESLMLALAPVIAGQDPGRWMPLIAVTPDGRATFPLLGGRQGGEALAQAVARALDQTERATAAQAQDPPAAASASKRAPQRRGRLAVVGLGPGSAGLMVPAVRDELDRAQDVVGYTTYVRMAGPFRSEQRILDSDNRREMDRARLAFSLAAEGRQVAVVSSGDPGVFAMAAAVLEALEHPDDQTWLDVDLVVLPGVSAAQAAAARVGAPLGHDFCVLSLSDNLKPWTQIEQRLGHAAAGDFVIALYNPSSLARPWQIESALGLLRQYRAPHTPVVLGRDIARTDEQIIVTTLGDVQPAQVDMRTVVIVGSSQTRQFSRPGGGAWVYTPRWYPDPAPARPADRNSASGEPT